MNPGYLTFLLLFISATLWASGWKDILFRDITHSRFLLFFIGWVALGWWSVPIGGLKVQPTALLLAYCVWRCTLALRDRLVQAHVWSAGLLLGAFDLFMREFRGWQVMMQPLGPYLPSVLILAASAFVLGRQPVWQFISLTVGLLSSEGVSLWLHRDQWGGGTVLGGAAFSDHWWAVLFMTLVLTAAAEQTVRFAAVSYRYLHRNRRNEWGD